jgi:hypothetical protein
MYVAGGVLCVAGLSVVSSWVVVCVVDVSEDAFGEPK